ncbi:MAG: response regulator transcription factor [Chloroherpetonaceae bacterium]|nr:response regulator transcription factor [Chloroherpetonaceae bacterium]
MQYNILLIDDEPMMLRVLKQYFRKSFNVFSCTDGIEALQYLHQVETFIKEASHYKEEPKNGSNSLPNVIPDVIVADLMMPNLDGYEFIKALRAHPRFKNVPLIMLSSRDTSADRIKCLKAGADDYVIKPFNPEELQTRIQNLLKRTKHVAA